MLSTEGLTYLVFNRRERQQIRTREILYEKLFILISATKKKKSYGFEEQSSKSIH